MHTDALPRLPKFRGFRVYLLSERRQQTSKTNKKTGWCPRLLQEAPPACPPLPFLVSLPASCRLLSLLPARLASPSPCLTAVPLRTSWPSWSPASPPWLLPLVEGCGMSNTCGSLKNPTECRTVRGPSTFYTSAALLKQKNLMKP